MGIGAIGAGVVAGGLLAGAQSATAVASGNSIDELLLLGPNLLSYVNDSQAAKAAQDELHSFMTGASDSVTIRNARQNLLDASLNPAVGSGSKRSGAHIGRVNATLAATVGKPSMADRLRARLLSTYRDQAITASCQCQATASSERPSEPIPIPKIEKKEGVVPPIERFTIIYADRNFTAEFIDLLA